MNLGFVEKNRSLLVEIAVEARLGWGVAGVLGEEESLAVLGNRFRPLGIPTAFPCIYEPYHAGLCCCYENLSGHLRPIQG